MRKAAILACVVIGAWAASWSAADEASPVWREDTYVAWKASQETGRPLLLFVTSENCPFCRKMDRDTFSDQVVREKLRTSFVAARVEASQQPELAKQLRVQAYPTTVVVDSGNRVLGAIPGYLEPREFERRLAQFTE